MAENNGNESSNGKNVGRVEQVTGVVVDVVFGDDPSPRSTPRSRSR